MSDLKQSSRLPYPPKTTIEISSSEGKLSFANSLIVLSVRSESSLTVFKPVSPL